jgi:hypothetical protein
VTRADLDVLPEWPEGTVAVLATAAGAPHAIPVSTVLRDGDRRVLLALAKSRESLRRLREDPQVAVVLLAAGNVAVTASGRAEVLADSLPGIDPIVPVRVEVEAIQDHRQETFTIGDGVQWRWLTEKATERDARTREALAAFRSTDPA